MSKNQFEVARLALRLEGEDGCDWNAYITPPGTMEGAILVATVKRPFVQESQELRELYIAFCSKLVEEFVKSATEAHEVTIERRNKGTEH